MTKCKFNGCKKRSTYNYEGEKTAIYCNAHKLNGMINVKHKTCIFDGCKKQPTYNYEGEKTAIYCNAHKLNGMINVKHKRCILCNYIRANRKYKPYCFGCYQHLFPEKANGLYVSKEREIKKILKLTFLNIDFIHDSKIICGCTNRRPDFVLDLFNRVFIIEVDENQHKKYDTNCDNKRTVELYQAYNNRPLTILRFNPDKYIDNNNYLHNPLINIISTKKVNYTYIELYRLNMFIATIRFILGNDYKEEKMINIIKLFYDGCEIIPECATNYIDIINNYNLKIM